MIKRNKLFIGYYIITFLMVSIFISAPLFQAFHSHDTQMTSVSSDQEILVPYEADCHLCYHFAHQQQSDILPLTTLSIAFFGNVPSIPITHHVLGLVALPGLSWTNKGPPAPLA